MNILMAASDNYEGSGAFRSMVKLCALLRNEFNHNVYVLLSRDGTGEKLLDDNNIPYYKIRSYNWIIKESETYNPYIRAIGLVKKNKNRKSVKQIKELIKKLDIDIVHLNTSWTYAPAVAAAELNVPYVWHIREFLEEDQNARMWNRNYGYSLMKGASQVIAISKSIKAKYDALLDNGKVVTVFNGVDDSEFADKYHEVLKDNKAKLLIVGTISENKGQIQLLKACVKLKERGITCFKLDIVGKGNAEYENKLKSFCGDNELNGFVEFVGFESNCADCYKNADITFVCSRAEAFGRVTVEAMMAGSLIIGADAGATPELIEDNKTGLLYHLDDIDGLADKIEWALSNRENARKIAAGGRAYMLSNMTAKKNAENISLIYEKQGLK